MSGNGSPSCPTNSSYDVAVATGDQLNSHTTESTPGTHPLSITAFSAGAIRPGTCGSGAALELHATMAATRRAPSTATRPLCFIPSLQSWHEIGARMDPGHVPLTERN